MNVFTTTFLLLSPINHLIVTLKINQITIVDGLWPPGLKIIWNIAVLEGH